MAFDKHIRIVHKTGTDELVTELMAALQVSYLRSIYNCLKNYSVIGSSRLSLDFLGFIEPISFFK